MKTGNNGKPKVTMVARLTALAAVSFLTFSNDAHALPGVGGVPKVEVKMPKVSCGRDAPSYLPLPPDAGLVISTTVAFYNTENQLYRATLCSQSASADLLEALGLKAKADDLKRTVANYAAKDPTPEQRASIVKLDTAPIAKAIDEALETLDNVDDTKKGQIRAANLKRVQADLALASLIADVGRLTMDITSLAKKIKDKDPAVAEELVKAAQFSAFAGVNPTEVIASVWPAQIKDIGGNAKTFNAAEKAVSKSVKSLQKKLKIDPPSKAEIQAADESSGG